MSSKLDAVNKALSQCLPEDRLELFRSLRREFPIHPLEREWGVNAETILEAISRSNDLTQRGVRGVVAEAAFANHVLASLSSWRAETAPGENPYDFLLADAAGPVRVQVKLQRRKAGKPMMANQGYRRLSADKYVVEVQRTRGGSDRAGENTRPYRFGEFDVLCVCLQPSTGRWDRFMYTVANWLIPRPEDRRLMLKFQPVPPTPDDEWTDEFATCVEWLRSGKERTLTP